MAIKRSDVENLSQLALDLDLPAPDEDAGLNPDEVKRISMDAMHALDARMGQDAAGEEKKSAWFRDYLRLKEMGWDWRVAAYIAWEASPKVNRWPETITDLATEVLGLKSPRVIYTWRKKNPTIDEVVSVMQTAALYEHRRDVIEALIQVASDPDYKAHSDRKLYFEMLGDYTPRQQVDVNDKRSPNDLSELSDDELRKRAEMLKDRDDAPPSSSPLKEGGGQKTEEENGAS